MQNQQGYFVVQRINWFDRIQHPHVIERKPSIAGTHEEIIKRYRGIEGTAWPQKFDNAPVELRYGLAALAARHSVKGYFNKLCNMDSSAVVDCIICCRLQPNFSTTLYTTPVQFLGFDYGYLVSETNNYSVIFNEVIYGRYPQLTAFGAMLNTQCLLSTPEQIISLQNARLELLVDGADIESDEECCPFAIYAADLVER